MKVFATLVQDGSVVLKTWSSCAQFSKTESWVDNTFIYIATSYDFKGDYLHSPVFDYDLPSETTEGNFNIVHSKEQRQAHALMCQARRDYMAERGGR